ncbi:hypothetical protein H5T54_07435, partial [Candidatus Bipolaricaulota bacterium]|nr:hypothetical protein [Candidatus Bipolaricaulota bacterium]
TNPAPISGGTAQVTIRATTPGLVKVHALADVLGTGTVTAETGVGASGPDAEKSYEYRQARIRLSPLEATNEVGAPHTFTATVEVYVVGTGWVAAPNGTPVTFSFASNPIGATFVGPSSTTTSGGQAQATITATQPGTVTVNAQATVGTLTVETNGSGENSAPATKSYEYRQAKIDLTPGSDTNEVGEDHVITATVWVWNGASWVVPPNGGSVTFSLASDTTGTATIVTTNPAPISGGTAQVTLRATTPGLVKVHAVADVLGTGTVTAETGVGASGPDATKTYEYRQARIRLTPLVDTNEVGENHTFTATVEVYVVGTGWVPAPNGTPVTFSFASNPIGATFVGPSSTTTSGGQAQATITATQPGTVTVKAQATVGSLTVETNGSGENSTPAEKTYVNGYIAITPGSATNEVGDPHTFLITAYAQGAAPSGWSLAYTVTPSPASATLSTPTVAPDGMSATWNLTINHPSPAVFTVSATVTMTFAGGTQIVRTTDGTGGSSTPATKTYVDARISLSPLTATNEVGEPHTLVALVETTSDGSTWSPEAGVAVTFSILSGTATFVGGTNTSVTNGAGQATVQIISATPGTVAIQAAADLFGDGAFIRTTGTAGNGANAQKTYVDARISVTPLDSVNPVGTSHTVTALVEVNTGTGWVPAPNGTPVVFTLLNNTAGATFVTAPTTSTTGGQASVTVFSSNPGGVAIQATADVAVTGLVLRRATGSGDPNG